MGEGIQGSRWGRSVGETMTSVRVQTYCWVREWVRSVRMKSARCYTEGLSADEYGGG
jgi:hypothetical protein